jgi:NTP pyrophosphatase (non-canonical NTP hydrolase)
MTLQEYQEWSKQTAKYPESFVVTADGVHHDVQLTFPFYLCLGLAGEAGEVVEVIKKFARREDTKLNQEELSKLKLELGDLIWYWTQICTEVGFTMEEVLEANKQKLEERYGKNNG